MNYKVKKELEIKLKLWNFKKEDEVANTYITYNKPLKYSEIKVTIYIGNYISATVKMYYWTKLNETQISHFNSMTSSANICSHIENLLNP